MTRFVGFEAFNAPIREDAVALNCRVGLEFVPGDSLMEEPFYLAKVVSVALWREVYNKDW